MVEDRATGRFFILTSKGLTERHFYCTIYVLMATLTASVTNPLSLTV